MTPPDFITVDDVKTFLKKTTDTDDVKLTAFISAACTAIVERIGQVSPVVMIDEFQVYRPREAIVLPERPVIAVTAVVMAGNPVTIVPAADPDNGVAGWLLKDGVLRHSRCWPIGTIRVTYEAGRTPLPGNVRLAALEMTGHLWRSSQLNAAGGRPGIPGSDEVVMPGSAFALPLRVRELLGLGKLFTDEILVG